MHALRCTTAAATIFLFTATVATANDQQVDQQQPARPAIAAHNPSTTSAPAPSANQWRYRRHGGRWWYWMPDNRWVVWQRNAWAPYSPGMFARESTVVDNARYATGRRYSYRPQPEVYYPNYGWRLEGYSRGVRSAGSKVRGDYMPE
jgi:hypothetical protein